MTTPQSAIELNGVASPDFLWVPKEAVAEYWPQIVAVLREAPNKGALAVREEEELLATLVDNPYYGCWVGVHQGTIEAVLVVTMSVTSKEAVVWLETANSTHFSKYIDYISRIEDWAYQLGASSVKFNGPPGWKRFMGRYGYEAKEYVFSKPIRKLRSH